MDELDPELSAGDPAATWREGRRPRPAACCPTAAGSTRQQQPLPPPVPPPPAAANASALRYGRQPCKPPHAAGGVKMLGRPPASQARAAGPQHGVSHAAASAGALRTVAPRPAPRLQAALRRLARCCEPRRCAGEWPAHSGAPSLQSSARLWWALSCQPLTAPALAARSSASSAPPRRSRSCSGRGVREAWVSATARLARLKSRPRVLRRLSPARRGGAPRCWGARPTAAATPGWSWRARGQSCALWHWQWRGSHATRSPTSPPQAAR